jgi:hypothetical protein
MYYIPLLQVFLTRGFCTRIDQFESFDNTVQVNAFAAYIVPMLLSSFPDVLAVCSCYRLSYMALH